MVRLIQIFSLVLVFLSLQGCGAKNELHEEMDLAYKSFKGKISKDNEKGAAVNNVVRKYFPAGMPLTDALKILDEGGFEIMEYRQNGLRKWPDGQLRPYLDVGYKKGAISEDYVVNYHAARIYDNYLIFNSEAIIVLRSKDGNTVSDISSGIHLNAL